MLTPSGGLGAGRESGEEPSASPARKPISHFDEQLRVGSPSRSISTHPNVQLSKESVEAGHEGRANQFIPGFSGLSNNGEVDFAFPTILV
jgi:hypothetical protein